MCDNYFKYPYLPEYTIRLDLGYWIGTLFTNSNRISTEWINVPETVPLSDNTTTTDLPSGFLSVLTPFSDSSDPANIFTCSIDARWALGNQLGSPVGDLDAEYVQRAEILRTRSFAPDLPGFQYNFLPIKDGSWRRLQIDTDWLNTLTPLLDDSGTSGWTSLAALFTGMGLDNSTGMIVDWSDVSAPLESAIAAVVADGMSRLGYSLNGGSLTHFSDSLAQLQWDDSLSSQQGMLAGTYQFPAPDPGPATQLHWSVVISGYAYRADSAAYYLALSVLFLHAAMALCHVFYMVWKKICCSAWGSLTGLVVLAARSGTPQVANDATGSLENTSSGIERYRTMGTKVRIRNQPAPISPTTDQTLQGNIRMLFGEEIQAAGYEDLQTFSEVNTVIFIKDIALLSMSCSPPDSPPDSPSSSPAGSLSNSDSPPDSPSYSPAGSPSNSDSPPDSPSYSPAGSPSNSDSPAQSPSDSPPWSPPNE
ncbi:MAG: hypothetical protein OHK93_002595 [Ramalina farinacea]|uniref:Uncharacterized protein n=1 Tax=Ramalina farinacea TaxID=258253 RepID=A0AA43TTX1_9LECA|nr:hypothetical protein [Ramalina farinacea]